MSTQCLPFDPHALLSVLATVFTWELTADNDLHCTRDRAYPAAAELGVPYAEDSDSDWHTIIFKYDTLLQVHPDFPDAIRHIRDYYGRLGFLLCGSELHCQLKHLLQPLPLMTTSGEVAWVRDMRHLQWDATSDTFLLRIYDYALADTLPQTAAWPAQTVKPFVIHPRTTSVRVTRDNLESAFPGAYARYLLGASLGLEQEELIAMVCQSPSTVPPCALPAATFE